MGHRMGQRGRPLKLIGLEIHETTYKHFSMVNELRQRQFKSLVNIIVCIYFCSVLFHALFQLTMQRFGLIGVLLSFALRFFRRLLLLLAIRALLRSLLSDIVVAAVRLEIALNHIPLLLLKTLSVIVTDTEKQAKSSSILTGESAIAYTLYKINKIWPVLIHFATLFSASMF